MAFSPENENKYKEIKGGIQQNTVQYFHCNLLNVSDLLVTDT